LTCAGLQSSPTTDDADLPENIHRLDWSRCAPKEASQFLKEVNLFL
jgi:hypothetical protein